MMREVPLDQGSSDSCAGRPPGPRMQTQIIQHQPTVKDSEGAPCEGRVFGFKNSQALYDDHSKTTLGELQDS